MNENMNIGYEDQNLREVVDTICRMAKEHGGRAMLVGGCVRDSILNLTVKDVDIEIYGIQPDNLISLISSRFKIDLVGRAFGVIKLQGMPVDLALPRRESKSGHGHKAFEIMSDPFLPPEEAACRRDFTINSISYDPLANSLFDPFHGREDLAARILRHTSGHFVEDPLRVLRGMQFAARFQLTPDPATLAICRTISMEDLSRERVFEEWRKLILLGTKPSMGLDFLRNAGWVPFFPELAALINCRQEPDWHPEGDVWTHTLHAMDAFAAERIGDPHEDLIVGFAVLCHDFGKPATTKSDDGVIRSLGHTEAGEEPTRSFLSRMTAQEDIIEAVISLVVTHMRPDNLFSDKAGDSAIRRLAARVGRIDRLVRVARADSAARPPLPFTDYPAGDWLLERARALQIHDSRPKPIMLGRHLIALGLSPGPQFKSILDKCFEAQLSGKISNPEEGIAFCKELLGSQPK